MLGLHHLDDTPVTPKERRLAIAFLQGGLQVSHYFIPGHCIPYQGFNGHREVRVLLKAALCICI